jgi:hypothetical protein
MILLKSLLFENYQLAKKLYIDTNIIDNDVVKFLSDLSNKDYTFKVLADVYIQSRQDLAPGFSWENAVIQFRNYNKNVFPIKNFSFDDPHSVVGEVKSVVNTQLLVSRNRCLKMLHKWPSFARRNLAQDIKIPRNTLQFFELYRQMEYINQHLSLLDNRPDGVKQNILRKIFSSNHPRFEDVLNFVEDKENLLNGIAYSKDELYNIVRKHSYDLKIVYDKGNIVIVDVTGQTGIKHIGCNSLWCFTYGDEYGHAGEQWNDYSYNGHVYAIINFSYPQDSPEFIHIVTKQFKRSQYRDPRQLTFAFDKDDNGKNEDPDSGIYDMANNQVYGDAETIIKSLTNNDIDALNVFNFEDL